MNIYIRYPTNDALVFGNRSSVALKEKEDSDVKPPK